MIDKLFILAQTTLFQFFINFAVLLHSGMFSSFKGIFQECWYNRVSTVKDYSSMLYWNYNFTKVIMHHAGCIKINTAFFTYIHGMSAMR